MFPGWYLAWKLVLVHVPLVQEIFGLRKKPAKFKPQTRRISRYYNSINARNSSGPGTEGAASQPSYSAVAPHGILVTVEFKPVEHPIEPLDNDQPIQCPVPEPSILNERRIWKERVSATVRRRNDLPVMREDGGGAPEPESAGSHRPPRIPMRSSNWLILSPVSAPEHNLLKLLEECNASGI